MSNNMIISRLFLWRKGTQTESKHHFCVIVTTLLLLAFPFLFSSCDNDDNNDGTIKKAQKTVFMYLPWTGDSNNLYYAFQQNLSDIKAAITSQGGLDNKNMMIFISQNATNGVLMKMKFKKGECVYDTIRTYNNTQERNLALNTSHWITYIMNQISSYAPADTYSLIIGGHGYGWINASDFINGSSSSAKGMFPQTIFYGEDGTPVTRVPRSFGGSAILTDISTLAQGIAASNIKKMQFILFDNCNMSNIETAYELKDVTDYLIACPTEIMGYGMPYQQIWKDIISDTPDYGNICDKFHEFYNSYNAPLYNCGTIGVTNCSEVEKMADIMKRINAVSTPDYAASGNIQKMDGYEPSIFYDLGDYVRLYCSNKDLLNEFEEQLKVLVPFKSTTEYYYTALSSHKGKHKVSTYSGITISDPSTNHIADGKTSTSYYIATH